MSRFLLLLTSAVAKDCKVISYTGQGAGDNNPDVAAQHMCFERDLVPGIKIRGTKQSTINARTLQGYDVLLMPGGLIGYEEYVDQDAIRDFVKAGGGYYGTCAGAYAGCATVGADPATGIINPDTGRKVQPIGNDTAGNPIYPRERAIGVSSAHCDMFMDVADSQNALTPEGKKVFPNNKDTITIDHHNGPAMTNCEGDCTVLAKFQGGRRSGTASILRDTYGAGPVILISPHPEHPHNQNCELVVRAAAFACGYDGPIPSPTPTPVPTPSPVPPAQCHAISAVVSDDWCVENCASGFCPSDLCACDEAIAV